MLTEFYCNMNANTTSRITVAKFENKHYYLRELAAFTVLRFSRTQNTSGWRHISEKNQKAQQNRGQFTVTLVCLVVRSECDGSYPAALSIDPDGQVTINELGERCHDNRNQVRVAIDNQFLGNRCRHGE